MATTTKVCILCRCEFDLVQCKNPGGNIKPNIIINGFYNYLPIFGGGQENNNESKRHLLSSSSNVSSFVQLTFEAIMVCKECLPLLKSTLSRRRMVGDVEESVRRLQMKLLREMELLKTTLNQFYEEMRKIEVLMEDGLALAPSKTLSSVDLSAISIFEKRIKQVVKDLSTCACLPEKSDSSGNSTNESKLGFRFPGSDISAPSMNEDSDPDNTGLEEDNSRDEDYDPGVMETIQVNSDESSSSSSSDEDNEEDNKNDLDQAIREEKISTLKNSLKADTVDLSGMSHFKKCIVQRAIRRKSRILHIGYSSTLPKKNSSNPTSEYFFDYSAETGTLSLQDVILTINDQDPKNEFVECSKCEYRFHAKGRNYMNDLGKNVLLEHVLGKHLNAFYCQQCDAKFTSGQHFVTHMNAHTLSPTCDICGKPFIMLKKLEVHKWSHMSKEEVQQAIQSGKKYPRPNTVQNNVQCSICGMTISSKNRSHMLTHQDREQRTIMCPVCGKLVSKKSFFGHAKICRPEGEKTEPRVQCLMCAKTFKNMSYMKKHVFRMHSDKANERRHICETCGKAFKKSWDLRDHMKSHSTERPFGCKNECGSTFKARQACKRHEMVCNL